MAFADVAWRKLGAGSSTATLNGIYNLPARETSYLAQGADGTVGLIHKDIKGKGVVLVLIHTNRFPFISGSGKRGVSRIMP